MSSWIVLALMASLLSTEAYVTSPKKDLIKTNYTRIFGKSAILVPMIVSGYKYLGIVIDSTLNRKEKISHIFSKLRMFVYVFRYAKPVLSRERMKLRRLIENAGFGYENYTVTTEDGYVLNLNRMVNPKRKGANRGYPIFLLNGFFMQSEAWLVQSTADTNIAAVCARLGYDVWLGDQRGTMRSRGHVNLTTNDDKFWDFSFHESGVYDMSAFIDFILQKTGRKDVIFSCMSLGCSFHGTLISERPSYNEKIKAAIYFVPLVNNIRKVGDMLSLMQVWFKAQPVFANVYDHSGAFDLFPNLGSMRKEFFHICLPTKNIMITLSHLIFGSSLHIPAEVACEVAVLSVGGSNVKSAKHILQVYDTGDFAKYDYGREENMKRYGLEKPPLYDLGKITSFVAIYYSDSDVFSSTEGVQKTLRSLGGPSYSCSLPNFNHLDVAIGTTFKYAFPDVVEVLNALSGYKNNTEKLRSGLCPSMEWIRHLRN